MSRPALLHPDALARNGYVAVMGAQRLVVVGVDCRMGVVRRERGSPPVILHTSVKGTGSTEGAALHGG